MTTFNYFYEGQEDQYALRAEVVCNGDQNEFHRHIKKKPEEP